MLAVVIVLGPTLALFALAWVLMPAGFFAAAWPAAALLFSSTIISLPMLFAYRLHERWMDRAPLVQLPESAAEWLRRKLAAIGLGSVEVVTIEGEGSAYHPPSDTIILRESTYAEHTVRARAVAAHELGHAAFAHFSPRLSQLAMVARTWAGRLFPAAISFLIATALVPVEHLRSIAYIMIAASAALSAIIALEEAGASMRAARVLSDELDRPALRAAVTGHVLALMTYVFQLVPMIAALVFWPELTARLGDGVIELAAPLSGWAAALVQIGNLAILGGAIIGAVALASRRRGVTAVLALLAVLIIGPSLTFAIAGQELVLAHPWALALAAGGAWELVAMPLALVFTLVAGFASRGIDMVAPVTRFLDGPQLSSLGRVADERVPASQLARHERESLIQRAWELRWLFLYLPLVLAYWGLFG